MWWHGWSTYQLMTFWLCNLPGEGVVHCLYAAVQILVAQLNIRTALEVSSGHGFGLSNLPLLYPISTLQSVIDHDACATGAESAPFPSVMPSHPMAGSKFQILAAGSLYSTISRIFNRDYRGTCDCAGAGPAGHQHCVREDRFPGADAL